MLQEFRKLDSCLMLSVGFMFGIVWGGTTFWPILITIPLTIIYYNLYGDLPVINPFTPRESIDYILMKRKIEVQVPIPPPPLTAYQRMTGLFTLSNNTLKNE